MAIRENSAVKVVGGAYVGETGKVVRIYDDLGIALVALGKDSLGKVFLYDMVESRPQETEPKPEIPEGAKKISRADFDAALVEVTTKAMSKTGNLAGAMTGVIIGESIGSKIFKESDVVVMTEAEFIGALWEGCSPEAVNKTVGDEMPIGKTVGVAVAAIITLRAIPEILFGAEND